MTSGPTTKHPIVPGSHARNIDGSNRREAKLKQFANSSGSRWHSMLKSEVVNHRQFFRRKHDLQSPRAEIFHGRPPTKAFLQVIAKCGNYSMHSVNTGSVEY